MDIKLSDKHLGLVNGEDNQVKEQLEIKQKHSEGKFGIYDNKLDQYVCESYKKGIANSIILKEADISNGLMYTILRRYHIQLKGGRREIVHKRVKHVLDNPDKLKEFINDYELLSYDMLAWKYKLHKNGVYYILDLLDIPRKRQSRK
ncbi:hypothetical protein [Mammaliicoccus phage vB_MscM-PMS3]|nr:hypothetical protein [Mammaliicoccus phage vB_MscM-PMS3]